MKLQCATCGVDTGGINFCPQHRKDRVVVADGETLNGNNNTYKIQKVLSAKGGTAVTYLATDSSSNSVVVKELIDDPDPVMQKDNEIRFEREAILLQTLSSKFLPKGLDRFDEAGHRFFVQTYIPGTDLFDDIKNNGVIPPDGALEIGVKICEALGLLHDFKDPANGTADPILHRDIKPDNIMLTAHTGEPVLIDFGSAVKTQSNMIGATVMMPGTPGYMSQSRIQVGDEATDDLFSLAYTIIYLVTGEEPTTNNANRDSLLQKLPPSWKQCFDFATQDVILPGNKVGDVGFRPKDWQDFRTQLINLMSPAAASAYVSNVPTAPPAPVVVANVYDVELQPQTTFMPDAHTYCQPIQGRFLLNGNSAGGLLLTPIIFDIGGQSTANGKGRAITTGTLGEFTLAINDCTVPLAVTERKIELVFTDSAGLEVHRLQIQISRPRTAMAVNAGSSFISALKSPFAAFTDWRINRARIKNAVQQANLAQQTQLATVQGQIAAAQAQAKLAKMKAKQAAKQRIAQQKLQAKQAPDYVPPLGHVWNFLKPVMYFALLLGAIYLLYQLGVYLYAWFLEIDWKVWGPFVAKIAAGIVVTILVIYLTPKLYRLAKRHNAWGKIKSGLNTLWGKLKTVPNIIRGMVAGALIMATCVGAFTNQTWLILIPLGLLPLCYKWKSSAGWFLAVLITFTWEAIAFAICLSQIKQFFSQ